MVGDLEFTAAKDTSGARVLVLTLTPGLSSDGSQFKCRVIDSSESTYEKTITISVKGKCTETFIHVHTYVFKGELARENVVCEIL